MSNRFTNKTIEQLAKESLKTEDIADGIEIETKISALETIKEIIPIDGFEVVVDAYTDLRPFEDDFVVVTLWGRNKESNQPHIDLDIDDAERLGKLLLFQCKVARRAQEMKRKMIGK